MTLQRRYLRLSALVVTLLVAQQALGQGVPRQQVPRQQVPRQQVPRQRASQQRAVGQKLPAQRPPVIPAPGRGKEDPRFEALPFGGFSPIPPENAVKPGSLASITPPELFKAVQGLTFKNITPDRLALLFSKRLWVRRITDCILHIGFCELPVSLDLYTRIKNASDGGDFCPGCTRQETLNQLQAIIRAISIYRKHYPEQWKRVESKLLFVEDRI